MAKEIKTKDAEFTMIECGCCECYHKSSFHGDCRVDSERFLPHCGDNAPFITDRNGERWVNNI